MEEIIFEVHQIETKVGRFDCVQLGRKVGSETVCDGWSINSPAGRKYDLLEGMSLDGETTSDIVFIFESNENGYKNLVQYFFGSETPDALEVAVDYIKDYEAGTRFDLGKDIL